MKLQANLHHGHKSKKILPYILANQLVYKNDDISKLNLRRGLRGIERIIQWIRQSTDNVYMIQRWFEKTIIG